jgi:hypothetical protein
MAYAYPSEGSLDYYPCHYGASRLVFRGPKKALSKPYLVTIGGTETYGKFVPAPYPSVLEEVSGCNVVNLGWMNAGPDVFLNDPAVLDIASGAQLAIVQILGAQNLSNAFYSVHPRRNDRFLRASARLQNLYREVDFTEFHFTRHMLQSLFQTSPHRFVEVAAELQSTWMARMGQLLRAIKCPTILLWMGDRPPPQTKAGGDPYASMVLVSASMIDAMRSNATAYLEVVSSREAMNEGIENMLFSDMERPCAEGVPGPLTHREVAVALAAAVEHLMRNT